jgi:hypothetical protein
VYASLVYLSLTQLCGGQGGNEIAWGTQWIVDHVASQTRVGKPVILEEFGDTINQPATYNAWLNEVLSSGLTGYLIWQVNFLYKINRPPGLTISIIQASWFSSLKVFSSIVAKF